MNIDYKLIGARIKYERNKAGLTQEQLAEKLDVTIGYVSQVERGITKISLDLLARISTILDCDVASLITRSAVNTDGYIVDEILNGIRRLSGRDRRIVLSVIKSMLDDGRE